MNVAEQVRSHSSFYTLDIFGVTYKSLYIVRSSSHHAPIYVYDFDAATWVVNKDDMLSMWWDIIPEAIRCPRVTLNDIIKARGYANYCARRIAHGT